MSCAHCDDLEEELACLRRELGQMDDATAISRLSEALHIAPAPAKMLNRLYGAKGRSVSHWVIIEMLSPEVDQSKLPHVYASRLRKVLGEGSVINGWGVGYRLSPAAVDRVSEILSTPTAQGNAS